MTHLKDIAVGDMVVDEAYDSLQEGGWGAGSGIVVKIEERPGDSKIWFRTCSGKVVGWAWTTVQRSLDRGSWILIKVKRP